MGLASGWPTTEMPYSTSVPITRRTVMTPSLRWGSDTRRRPMGLWTDRIVPRLTDRALGSAEISQLRAATCAGLEGAVLEIGFGSGLNLPHYPAAVTSVSAVEPADEAWRLSARRRTAAPFPVERAGLDGQRLPTPAASYDGVL